MIIGHDPFHQFFKITLYPPGKILCADDWFFRVFLSRLRNIRNACHNTASDTENRVHPPDPFENRRVVIESIRIYSGYYDPPIGCYLLFTGSGRNFYGKFLNNILVVGEMQTHFIALKARPFIGLSFPESECNPDITGRNILSAGFYLVKFMCLDDEGFVISLNG